MQIHTRSVRLDTGVSLSYAEQGDPGGVPLLLLPGTSDAWRSYERLLPHLPGAVHAYAVSLRGHGDSDRPDIGYRPSDLEADVVAFMDALGIEAAVVAGHSASSVVARRLAIDHPDRVLALVLISPFFSLAENPAALELRDAVVEMDEIPEGYVQEFQESTLANPVPDPFLEMVVQESLKVPAHAWREMMTALPEDDSAKDLGRIEAPTRILWGDKDAFCPRTDQYRLVDTIVDARLEVYEGVGHAVHWEAPERAAADLVRTVEMVAH